jgi:predicted glycoside hydrolase/deacetylase ChbG (UPF0249 family)
VIRLVVNADDLGFDAAIDRGIFRAYRKGIVTSASLLVTGRTAAAAVRQALEERLPLGVHLCLTSMLPPASSPSTVPSLAPGGRFRKSWPQVVAAWAGGQLKLDQVRVEFESQIARARDLGAAPDHLDGHQHLHLLPGVCEVAQSVAAEAELPLRWPGEVPRLDWLFRPAPALKTLLLRALSTFDAGPARKVAGIGVFEAGGLDEDALLRLLIEMPDGEFELGCHPGSEVSRIPELPDWSYGWEQELRALCSPRVRQLVQTRGIRLCSYSELFS